MNQEAIKQFIIATVVPTLTASVVTWLVGHKVLSVVGLSGNVAAAAISQVLVWGVTAGISFLAVHHILLGHYTPGAKAAAAKR